MQPSSLHYALHEIFVLQNNAVSPRKTNVHPALNNLDTLAENNEIATDSPGIINVINVLDSGNDNSSNDNSNCSKQEEKHKIFLNQGKYVQLFTQ